MIARRFQVSGRVQGVGFRYFVVTCAARWGLTGWARNLPDGRVEVLAQGEPEALGGLEEDLRRGPRSARVDHVEAVEERADGGIRDFGVRP